MNLCGQVFLCALRRSFCHSTSLQNKKASEKYLARQETKPNRQTNHEHCIFANFKLSTETNPAIFSSCTHLDLGNLDAAELFLVHGLCTQTRQKEPRETWKSKPCLTTREKNKTDGTLTALSAQLFSLLFLTHKKTKNGRAIENTFQVLPDESFRPNIVQSGECSPRVTTCYQARRSRDCCRPRPVRHQCRQCPGKPHFHWISPQQRNES